MVAGADRIFATDVNNLIADSSLRPVLRIFQGVAQSIPHNTDTALTWDSEVFDSHNFHNPASNPSRVTPNIAGYYRFYMTMYFGAATDYTLVRSNFRLNGAGAVSPAANWGPPQATSGQPSSLFHTMLQAFNGTTDYLEVVVKHTNGAAAARNTNVANPMITLLEMEFIRDL